VVVMVVVVRRQRSRSCSISSAVGCQALHGYGVWLLLCLWRSVVQMCGLVGAACSLTSSSAGALPAFLQALQLPRSYAVVYALAGWFICHWFRLLYVAGCD
jgi:hypothetical protein